MMKDKKTGFVLGKDELGKLPFKPIDTDTEGITVGGGDTETLEFNEPGQRIVGVWMGFKQLEKPYESKLYEVHNAYGEFSFWGGAILDDRLEKIPMGSLLDITYNGNQKAKAGKDSYKTFTVRYYTLPSEFDPTKHVVYFEKDSTAIHFLLKGTEVPQENIPF